MDSAESISVPSPENTISVQHTLDFLAHAEADTKATGTSKMASGTDQGFDGHSKVWTDSSLKPAPFSHVPPSRLQHPKQYSMMQGGLHEFEEEIRALPFRVSQSQTAFPEGSLTMRANGGKNDETDMKSTRATMKNGQSVNTGTPRDRRRSMPSPRPITNSVARLLEDDRKHSQFASHANSISSAVSASTNNASAAPEESSYVPSVGFAPRPSLSQHNSFNNPLVINPSSGPGSLLPKPSPLFADSHHYELLADFPTTLGAHPPHTSKPMAKAGRRAAAAAGAAIVTGSVGPVHPTRASDHHFPFGGLKPPQSIDLDGIFGSEAVSLPTARDESALNLATCAVSGTQPPISSRTTTPAFFPEVAPHLEATLALTHRSVAAENPVVISAVPRSMFTSMSTKTLSTQERPPSAKRSASALDGVVVTPAYEDALSMHHGLHNGFESKILLTEQKHPELHLFANGSNSTLPTPSDALARLSVRSSGQDPLASLNAQSLSLLKARFRKGRYSLLHKNPSNSSLDPSQQLPPQTQNGGALGTIPGLTVSHALAAVLEGNSESPSALSSRSTSTPSGAPMQPSKPPAGQTAAFPSRRLKTLHQHMAQQHQQHLLQLQQQQAQPPAGDSPPQTFINSNTARFSPIHGPSQPPTTAPNAGGETNYVPSALDTLDGAPVPSASPAPPSNTNANSAAVPGTMSTGGHFRFPSRTHFSMLPNGTADPNVMTLDGSNQAVGISLFTPNTPQIALPGAPQTPVVSQNKLALLKNRLHGANPTGRAQFIAARSRTFSDGGPVPPNGAAGDTPAGQM